MAKNMLSCPIGIKMLINLHRNSLKKELVADTNFADILKIKEKFSINNKLFLLSSNRKCSVLLKNNLKVHTATFESKQEFIIAVTNWVHKYGCFPKFTPGNYISGTGLLINVCMYKGTWNNNKGNPSTIYNSFSYTEDIKYEPRILVVPTRDEGVLMAIVVPKENEETIDLAIELKERGLAAALNSIKPAFTVNCRQPLPIFTFDSAVQLRSSTGEMTITQYGEISTGKSGIDVKVLTCLPFTDDNLSFDYRTPPTSEKYINFAIVYQDIPIFTGQVLP